MTPLVRMMASRLRLRPHLLALGADAVESILHVAPAMDRAHVWTMLAADEDGHEGAMLDEQFDRLATACRRAGMTVTAPKRAMLIHAPGGAWRVEARVLDDPLDATRMDADALVVGEAMERFGPGYARALGEDLDFCLLLREPLGGADVFVPPHRADRTVRAVARRELGAADAGVMARRLRSLGWRVETDQTPSRATRPRGGEADGLIDRLADGVRAAGMAPALAESWRRARLDQAARGRLVIRLGQPECLGFPPQD